MYTCSNRRRCMPAYFTEDEDNLILGTLHDGYHGYLLVGGTRSYDSYQKRRRRLALASSVELLPLAGHEPSLFKGVTLSQTEALKRQGDFSWREATEIV